MSYITSYEDFFITEGKVSFDKMNLWVSSFTDNKGMHIQFLPDSKTMDSYTNEEISTAILSRLQKKMPDFAKALEIEHNRDLTGVLFRINPFSLGDAITNSLK
jgi:hypothetical protein